MRRTSVVVSLLAVALVGLFALRSGPDTAANGAPSSAAADGLVGTWRVTATAEGLPPHYGLATFAADGTVIIADVPSAPAEPGAPYATTFTSTGLGVWEATGQDEAAYAFEQLISDDKGNFINRLTLTGTRRLNPDGQTFTGTYAFTIVDPTGQTVFAGQGTTEGTRMTVERGDPPAA